ncbi:2-succinylbenzoate--CoA ligase [Leptolyngbya sp. FACHB-261]|uniref:2-succinylbenzoate--CoA ligase n=1 Tax=Leptolyngbya sp. FACHB-261 TaxID=2692806 RepID=UPI001686CB66|nr:2-succinylbenzoate--CoA ligase [Leptolyngbya sp. FACHB-261]MBD2099377.1 2-succinylbenzoate--CoA ligase [Leptolyngbya sp. FACHB-261]
MESPLDYLKQRGNKAWLIGHNSSDLLASVEELLEQFTQLTPFQRILLVETNPVRLIAGFVAGYAAGHQIFLGNSSWGTSEWQQVFALVQPQVVWGNRQHQYQYQDQACPNAAQEIINQVPKVRIMIPTGGSSGTIRFAMHTWETLMASAQGFRQYFQVSAVNSICVLPLHHVSGLMQFVRSLTSDGKLLIAPFAELKSGKLCHFNPTDFFLSLVPTQLQALLSNSTSTAWLSCCKTVLLGGAPAWPSLLDTARLYQIRLAPCYGMTETASQIATLKPEVFLQGNDHSGQVLPHAQVKIIDSSGHLLGLNQVGAITIQATSLALGYYPEFFPSSADFQTHDLGLLDNQGNLHVLGRSNDQIITGGENVAPVEVEAAIQSTQLVVDVAVVGLPDQYWGQVIAAAYVPATSAISSAQIHCALETKLARFKHPKLWLPVENLPRNAQGKINRAQLLEMISKWQQEQAVGSTTLA